MKVVLTGATGFVGKVIVQQLIESGDEVVILTRNIAKAALNLGSKCQYVRWMGDELIPAEVLAKVDGVINLLGENIGDKKWDEKQKKKIYDSRIKGTALLLESLEKANAKPKVFVSTSAVGIYGSHGSEDVTEATAVGSGFLADVCKAWEQEAYKAKSLGARVVIIRVGVVLGHGGGALQKMLPLFKMGVGGPAGSGKQYMSWIHIEDLGAMYLESLKNTSMQDIYNGTAPYPATNTEFAKALGKTLKRPAYLKAPSFALKLALGEMSEIILDGQKVLPIKFKEKHFRYRYPTLEMALKETAY